MLELMSMLFGIHFNFICDTKQESHGCRSIYFEMYRIKNIKAEMKGHSYVIFSENVTLVHSDESPRNIIVISCHI
jgi:hypothetical protein